MRIELNSASQCAPTHHAFGAGPLRSRSDPATTTILLVEDDASVRRVVAYMLRSLGFAVSEAGDGHGALMTIKEHPASIDALITDLVMPRMGGRELAETLRGVFPGLPVLFISGYADDVAIRRGLIDRDEIMLPKPLGREQLLLALNVAMGQPASRRVILDACPPRISTTCAPASGLSPAPTRSPNPISSRLLRNTIPSRSILIRPLPAQRSLEAWSPVVGTLRPSRCACW
jgi:CheY-like chemotaxis protein